MSFWDHLEALRGTLFRSVAAVALLVLLLVPLGCACWTCGNMHTRHRNPDLPGKWKGRCGNILRENAACSISRCRQLARSSSRGCGRRSGAFPGAKCAPMRRWRSRSAVPGVPGRWEMPAERTRCSLSRPVTGCWAERTWADSAADLRSSAHCSGWRGMERHKKRPHARS